jgi:hypothetical protein
VTARLRVLVAVAVLLSAAACRTTRTPYTAPAPDGAPFLGSDAAAKLLVLVVADADPRVNPSWIDKAERAADAVAAAFGVELEDGVVKPKRMRGEKIGRGRWELTITIAEGKNREIRRLCEALGLQVDRLVRVKFGPVELGDLPVGKVRSLTRAEIKALEKV